MGCGHSSSANERSFWAVLKSRIPDGRNDVDAKKRAVLFEKFDEKKNKSLSENECLTGCKIHLDLEKLTKNLKDINSRAFKASSSLRTRPDATSGVDPAEFRLYLMYLRKYFDLQCIFKVDKSGNKIVSKDEFKKAVPMMENCGVKIGNPETAFNKIDKDGKGVKFAEFSDWAIHQKFEVKETLGVKNSNVKKKNGVVDKKDEVGEKNHGNDAVEKKYLTVEKPKKGRHKGEGAEKKGDVNGVVEKVEIVEKDESSEKDESVEKVECGEKKEVVEKVENGEKVEIVEKVESGEKDESVEKVESGEKDESVEKVESVEKDEIVEKDESGERDEVVEKVESVEKVEIIENVAVDKAEIFEEKENIVEIDVADKTDAERRKSFWIDLQKRLPRGRTPEELTARNELFEKFDPNNNGYLSLSEVYAGCCDILEMTKFTENLYPIVIKAFNGAKDVHQKNGKGSERGGDFIERVEFRLLLVYLYDYFEMWVAFDQIDTGGDHSVSLEEFRKAVPTIESWGVKVDDIEETFKAIDTSASGSLSFTEFCTWAIGKHLDVDGSSDE